MNDPTNYSGATPAGPIPGCGHFVVEERPEEIARDLLAMTSKSGGR